MTKILKEVLSKKFQNTNYIHINKGESLSESEINILDSHSLLNILSGILWFLDLFKAQKIWVFKNTETSATCLLNEMKNWVNIRAKGSLSDLFNFKNAFKKDLEKLELDSLKEQTIKNIDLIFTLIDTFVIQIEKKRSVNSNAFQDVIIDDLKNNLTKIYKLIAKNSRWKYWIVFDKKKKNNNDYFIWLDFKSTFDQILKVPVVLEEIIRDLSLNSRKYSAIWSEILVTINQTTEKIVLIVQDEWIWIPEDEIKIVFWINNKVTNADSSKTWFWLWLTKTLHNVKTVLWWEVYIKSLEWEWTKIKIIIPNNTPIFCPKQ